MDLSKYIDWIKLSPKYLFAIAFITGILLFAPTNTLESLGLTQIVSQYKPYIGALFLISLALFLVHPLAEIYNLITTRAMTTMLVKSQQKDIHSLTEDEKKVLRGYIYKKTQSQYLSPIDGVTNGLEAKRIIFRSSNFGKVNSFAYNIHPWAWKYLNKNPDLLLPLQEQEQNVNK